MCLVLLHLILLCLVDLSGWSSLFSREMEAHKSGGEGRLGRGTGRSGERGSCSWDVLYEKRINKKNEAMNLKESRDRYML